MRNNLRMTKVTDRIDGEWLRDAITALGVSVSDVQRKMGLNHNKRLYQHFNNDSHLGGSHLLAFKRAYPTVNLNYVVAGEGSPISVESPHELPTVHIPKTGAIIRVEE